MLARGPADFDSRRAISSCDMSGCFFTAYGGGSSCLWPTASSAIASRSCFLVSMVISLVPQTDTLIEVQHRLRIRIPGAVMIDAYGPPRASEVATPKGEIPNIPQGSPFLFS